MRISDWSSDVCSSDLSIPETPAAAMRIGSPAGQGRPWPSPSLKKHHGLPGRHYSHPPEPTVPPAPAIHRHGRSAARTIAACRSEEHTSELQSLMRTSYAVFCLKNKKKNI